MVSRFMLARTHYPRFINCVLELLHRRIPHERTVEWNGLRVQICPQVFNPITGRTTQFFIEHMKIRPDSQVLEIGTGSGAIAAAAAQIAQFVIATDVNPYAVRCAQTTIRQNGLANRVKVRLGDLFAPVHGARFDIILFNPPYFRFDPQSWVAKAWCAGSKYQLFVRFLEGARKVLTPSGEIQILLSSASDLPQIIRLIKTAEFRIELISQGQILGPLERLYLFRLS
jgi:release factor glutamine methyltransferase